MSPQPPHVAAPIGFILPEKPAPPTAPDDKELENVNTAEPIEPDRRPILSRESCTVVCPECHQTVQTKDEDESDDESDPMSCLIAVLVAAVGLCLCCFIGGDSDDCVESCVKSCVKSNVRANCHPGICCCLCCCMECCDEHESDRPKDFSAKHYCPNCKASI